MRLIEIKALENGAHRNLTTQEEYSETSRPSLPECWAVIPETLETPNFPFGDVTIEIINGVATVTKWVAREIPKTSETEPVSKMEQLRADVDYIAVMAGVEL